MQGQPLEERAQQQQSVKIPEVGFNDRFYWTGLGYIYSSTTEKQE